MVKSFAKDPAPSSFNYKMSRQIAPNSSEDNNILVPLDICKAEGNNFKQNKTPTLVVLLKRIKENIKLMWAFMASSWAQPISNKNMAEKTAVEGILHQ